MNMMIQQIMEKSQAQAKASFILGLAFWIPLLNLIFGALAVYYGMMALKNIRKEPAKFGGKWYARIGVALGSIVYITYLTGAGMCLSGFKEICKNIGLTFLA